MDKIVGIATVLAFGALVTVLLGAIWGVLDNAWKIALTIIIVWFFIGMLGGLITHFRSRNH